MSDERPSWYCCDFCKQPHTRENPLERASIKGVQGLVLQLHRGCIAGQQADLVNGAELVVWSDASQAVA